MSVEIAQKCLLAATPVVFYFFPDFILSRIYREYIKSTFLEMGINHQGAFCLIEGLAERVSRLLSFVAFLSIVAITVISTFYSKEHGSLFFKDCLLFASLFGLIGVSSWLFFINIKNGLKVNCFEKFLEIIAILLTVPLFYFWG